jgi:hypothetical protein
MQALLSAIKSLLSARKALLSAIKAHTPDVATQILTTWRSLLEFSFSHGVTLAGGRLSF